MEPLLDSFRCNGCVRRLLPMHICNKAQRRPVSDKSFAKRYGGGAGMGIMVMGASYAVLGGAVLVFLGSVSYTLWKSKRQSSITPSDTSTDQNNGTEGIPPANDVKEN
ncbi:uncharacterized protein [Dysidea avara]|uniref:uncharacterized protein n=1 Tax=Dysidea avara TaxID=196820 RepID=UPI003324A68A